MHRTLPARRRTTRSLVAVAALVLVPMLAAGCGDDSGDAEAEETTTVTVDQDGNVIDGDDGGEEGDDPDDDGDEAIPPLSQEQLDQAVLQPENFSEAWTSEPGDEEPASTGLGCWSDIDALTDSVPEQAKSAVEISYGDAALPALESEVSAYADEDQLTTLFDDFQAAVAECSTISGTDEDGLTWAVSINSDDTATEGVDDQVNLAGSGTVSNGDQSFDVYLYATFVRRGANLMTVSATDSVDRGAEWGNWRVVALDRFVAVTAGEEPPVATAPDPIS